MGKRARKTSMDRIGSAIKSLLSVMAQEAGSNPGKKAEILCRFAQSVETDVLQRAHLTDEQRRANSFVCWTVIERDEYRVPNQCCDDELLLTNPRSDLSCSWESPQKDDPDYCFYFCYDSVAEYDVVKKRIRRTMSYDEMARFIIFWFEEKILQILRKNRWDKVSGLVDLYDRMSFYLNEARPVNEILSTAREVTDLCLREWDEGRVQVSNHDIGDKLYQELFHLRTLLNRTEETV